MGHLDHHRGLLDGGVWRVEQKGAGSLGVPLVVEVVVHVGIEEVTMRRRRACADHAAVAIVAVVVAVLG
jgi:hypothetical protein